MNSAMFQNGSSLSKPNCFEEGKRHYTTSKDDCEKPRRRYSKRNKRFTHPLGRTIQHIENVPKGIVNHSYQDLSLVPPESGDKFPESVKEMSFSEKIHHMLSQEMYSIYAFWLPHGRAFKIEVPLSFENEVLPIYFGHKRYSTFLRELQSHGYKRITQGVDRNSYYHECMLRGLPHLSKFMPLPRVTRRLTDDAENEPDFHKISEAFPLPTLESESKTLENTSSSSCTTSFEPNYLQTPSFPQTFHPNLSKLSQRMDHHTNANVDAAAATTTSESYVAFSDESYSTSGQNTQQWHFCEPPSIQQSNTVLQHTTTPIEQEDQLDDLQMPPPFLAERNFVPHIFDEDFFQGDPFSDL